MRPNTYANTANVPARMAVRPVARPSRPSVRFTAFEVPVTTKVTNSTYSSGGKTSRMYLNTGSWVEAGGRSGTSGHRDRKSTRLNSSHSQISYAVFCLKKKKK